MRIFSARNLCKVARLFTRDPRAFFKKLYRTFRPMRKDYRKRFSMKLSQWLLRHNREMAFYRCHWMGVFIGKMPIDAWVYQEIVYDVQPDIIVEIGSYAGGSTLYFAHLLDLLGKGTVISIDIDRTEYCVKHDRIIVITGDSASREIIAEVSELCRGKSVLVVQDADHRKEKVLKDLEDYSRLVSVGSYFIVEDSIVDLFKARHGLWDFGDEPGPLAAVEQFISENHDFVVDTERERYILTYNPRGFLKRIR